MQLRNRRTKLPAAVVPPVSLGPVSNEDVVPSSRGPSDSLSTSDVAGRITLWTTQKPLLADSDTQPDSVQSPTAQTPIAQTTTFAENDSKAPKGHGTPRQLSPKHPALLRLRSIFGPQLSQKEYESYEAIVSILVRRSAREPKIREHYRPALRSFLDDNRRAVKIHNKFARSYNMSFEGKHERYHLPVFDDLEIEQERQTHLGQETCSTTTEQPQNITGDIPDDHTHESRRSAYGWLIDGAADMDPFPDDALDCVPADGLPTALNEEILQMSDVGCQHAEPGDLDIEDVAMMDAFEQPAPPRAQAQTTEGTKELYCNGAEEKEACGSAVVNTQGASIIGKSEVIHPDRSLTQETSAASQGLLQPAVVESSRVLEEGTSHADGNLAEDSIAPQSEVTALDNEILANRVACADSEQPRINDDETIASANMTETEANPSSGSSGRGDMQRPLGADGGLFGETSSIPSVGIARHRSTRSVESVECYLAWLAHRRSQFPTAPPNSTECILIAKKLGRSSVEVYDEIMWHWGMETSSKLGEWHKQNRLQVLGEDPVFDEDNKGRWQAWLEDGRNEMKARLGR